MIYICFARKRGFSHDDDDDDDYDDYDYDDHHHHRSVENGWQF